MTDAEKRELERLQREIVARMQSPEWLAKLDRSTGRRLPRNPDGSLARMIRVGGSR